MVNFNGAVKSGESRVNKSGDRWREGQAYVFAFVRPITVRRIEINRPRLDTFFLTLSIRSPIIDTLLIDSPASITIGHRVIIIKLLVSVPKRLG